ncbi:hypothetical protein ACH5RR_000867 [Cinchona calisaya]|uniref:Uncharacterized protein n=1 Tax=Cinchona calisaya TaxID=153742 RepID=A0ABD3B2B6_9GENT
MSNQEKSYSYDFQPMTYGEQALDIDDEHDKFMEEKKTLFQNFQSQYEALTKQYAKDKLQKSPMKVEYELCIEHDNDKSSNAYKLEESTASIQSYCMVTINEETENDRGSSEKRVRQTYR